MTIIFDDFCDEKHYVTTPVPPFPRGGHVFVHNFCIYFWKGWRGTWTIQWGVRHTTFVYPTLTKQHSTYYMMTFVWQCSFVTINIPHVDVHSTHWWFPCWWSSTIFVLMMIVIDDDLPRCLHVYFSWSPLTINATIPSIIKNVMLNLLLSPTMFPQYPLHS
jgi:hypothetical protein